MPKGRLELPRPKALPPEDSVSTKGGLFTVSKYYALFPDMKLFTPFVPKLRVEMVQNRGEMWTTYALEMVHFTSERSYQWN